MRTTKIEPVVNASTLLVPVGVAVIEGVTLGVREAVGVCEPDTVAVEVWLPVWLGVVDDVAVVVTVPVSDADAVALEVMEGEAPNEMEADAELVAEAVSDEEGEAVRDAVRLAVAVAVADCEPVREAVAVLDPVWDRVGVLEAVGVAVPETEGVLLGVPVAEAGSQSGFSGTTATPRNSVPGAGEATIVTAPVAVSHAYSAVGTVA